MMTCPIFEEVLEIVNVLGQSRENKENIKKFLQFLEFVLSRKKFDINDIETEFKMSKNTIYKYLEVLKTLQLCKTKYERYELKNKKYFFYTKSKMLPLFLFFILSDFRCPRIFDEKKGAKILDLIISKLKEYKNLSHEMKNEQMMNL